MNRSANLFLALLLLPALLMPLVITAIVVRLTSRGPVIFWSTRVGVDDSRIRVPKFRTFKVGAPNVASDLLENPSYWMTRPGWFLRKYSIDELPQIYSILKGDMHIVGPRPALISQKELIELRRSNNLLSLVPGLTGWAQINGRDSLTIEKKIFYEKEYLSKRSFCFDLMIIVKTVAVVLSKKGVAH